ncbi:MAG: hypothetical protein K2G40_02825, partial [Muribaculaceae bacterium]|nr:hypothetical protein [Muribaculaceae bacterium]
KSKIYGDYGYYNELLDSAFVTGNALAVDYSDVDSLSLHGDTIKAFRVITTIQQKPQNALPQDIESTDSNPQIIDSDTIAIETGVIDPETHAPNDSLPGDPSGQTINDSTVIDDSINVSITDTVVNSLRSNISDIETTDTTHHILAYPNVRFYRRDLQGVCDSLTFVQKDSLLYMDRDPVVWSDQRQIFGDVIIVHMNDSTADRINLPRSAFMAEMLEEGFYNQLSGREMTAYLADNTLKHVDVSGNVSLIFFPMEEDSTYNKVANAESSFLSADFNKGQITRMKMWSQSSETITPLYLAKRSLFFLPNFKWEINRRPIGHHDVMPIAPPTQEAITNEENEVVSSDSDKNEEDSNDDETTNSEAVEETGKPEITDESEETIEEPQKNTENERN